MYWVRQHGSECRSTEAFFAAGCGGTSAPLRTLTLIVCGTGRAMAFSGMRETASHPCSPTVQWQIAPRTQNKQYIIIGREAARFSERVFVTRIQNAFVTDWICAWCSAANPQKGLRPSIGLWRRKMEMEEGPEPFRPRALHSNSARDETLNGK